MGRSSENQRCGICGESLDGFQVGGMHWECSLGDVLHKEVRKIKDRAPKWLPSRCLDTYGTAALTTKIVFGVLMIPILLVVIGLICNFGS